MTTMLPSPFIFDAHQAAPVPVEHVSHPQDHRFVLDEALFLSQLSADGAVDEEPPPLFLRDPSPDYLSALDILPVLEVIAGHFPPWSVLR